MATRYRLDQVAEIVGGATPDTQDESLWNGQILWATPKDLSKLATQVISNTERKITQRGLDSCAATILPIGSVLFSSRAPIGLVAINAAPMATNQGFKSFIPKPDKLDSKYLYHWLRVNRQTIDRMGVGATFKEVSKKVVSAIEIALPSLPEQRRIAAILDKADEIRKRRELAIQKLDLLAESVFVEMFGDPAANPLKWDTCAVGKLLESAEFFVDGDWVESKDQDPAGDVRLIQLADVGDGNFIDKSRRFLTKDTARRLKCTFLKEGDLLVARMPDPLGRSCLLPSLPMECVTVVDVCVIRPRVSEVNPLWLMHCINSSGFRSLISAKATGSTRVRISRGNLSRLQIISPPISLQREFASRITKINALKSAAIGSADMLKLLDGSLRSIVFGNLVT